MIPKQRQLLSVPEGRRRSSKLKCPQDGSAGTRSSRVLVRFLFCIIIFSLQCGIVPADPVDDLTLGEAYYMSGDLSEAARSLAKVVGSKSPVQAQRALYLLGRISLLTGDFRQAKEYFERSADIEGAAPVVRIKALTGIGDTLYAGGLHEEAIRRYRITLRETKQGNEKAVINLKIALCEHALSQDAITLKHLRAALEKIPILSGWIGREEEFYRSMAVVGLDPNQLPAKRIYIVVGPIEGDFRVDEVVESDIQVKEKRSKNKTYLEFGPFTDPVEAMIVSEKIRGRFLAPVEIITR